MPRAAKDKPIPSTATIGIEAAIMLRNNMDEAELSGARQAAKGSPQGEVAAAATETKQRYYPPTSSYSHSQLSE